MNEISELKKALQNHEERISKLEKSIIGKKPNEFRKKKSSIMDLLLEVKNDGFFDKPKFQKDIVEKFEEMGFIYDTKSLSNPISRALKSRILGRKRIDGKWGYVKR